MFTAVLLLFWYLRSSGSNLKMRVLAACPRDTGLVHADGVYGLSVAVALSLFLKSGPFPGAGEPTYYLMEKAVPNACQPSAIL